MFNNINNSNNDEMPVYIRKWLIAVIIVACTVIVFGLGFFTGKAVEAAKNTDTAVVENTEEVTSETEIKTEDETEIELASTNDISDEGNKRRPIVNSTEEPTDDIIETDFTETSTKIEPTEIIETTEPIETTSANEPASEISEDDVELLAIVIYQEAGADYCCDDCRRRVADVVLNRVESEYYPDTIYEVLMQPYQYGRFHWTGVVWPESAYNEHNQDAVERARRIAREVLSGQHSEVYGDKYIGQAEFVQGTSGFWCCGIYFARYSWI